jgi:hypothetical protein
MLLGVDWSEWLRRSTARSTANCGHEPKQHGTVSFCWWLTARKEGAAC